MTVRVVSTISEIRPIEVPSVKQNNFIDKGLNLARQLKFLVILQSFIGINRLYLFQCNKILQLLSYIYIPTLIVTSVYIILKSNPTSPTDNAVRDIMCAEYITLVIMALFLKRHKLLRFLENLSTFDELLKIDKDIHVLNTTNRMVYCVIGYIFCNVVEFTVYKYHIGRDFDFFLFFFIYVFSSAHDLEQIFFFTLLRMIYTRITVVRTHICQAFHKDDNKRISDRMTLNKIESLSNNTVLDISSLHRVYQLLHKCSDQLNTIMSIPVLIMLFTSGFLTTVLLRILVNIIQVNQRNDLSVSIVPIVYIVARCVKLTILVIIPCYYTNITSTQVSTIRTTLHNAINILPLDKLERRKVKAFYLLTKEHGFTYALAGVINLNMTLPLSYLNLCTTYLVITIQFSKFID